jgi:hypothetical protein
LGGSGGDVREKPFAHIVEALVGMAIHEPHGFGSHAYGDEPVRAIAR